MTRLDAALVERGLARSRGQARELVGSGRVLVAGSVVTKAARDVGPEDAVEVAGGVDRYVGRAAHKLVAALDHFPIPVEGRRCLDVGASTGGFTQVLLERGAAHVVALDVGHGQLAASVAADPRVEERSGTSVRGLAPEEVGGPVDLLVTDLSFISLTLVAAELRALVTDEADLVVLVKPQFEVGRGRLGKNGVVRDPDLRREAVHRVLDACAEHGLRAVDVRPSPIVGTDGNVEVLVWLTPREEPARRPIAPAVADATRDPSAREGRPAAPEPPGGAAAPAARPGETRAVAEHDGDTRGSTGSTGTTATTKTTETTEDAR